jgi:enediyne biosynthesis protein E4
VTAGNLVQEQEVRSGGSYISQSDLRLHFWLRKNDHADKVEIFWPAGEKEVLPQLATDHFYCILEGKGIVSPESVRPQVPKT